MSIAGPGRTRLPRLRVGAFIALCLLALSAAPAMAAAPKPGPWIELGSGSDRNFLWSVKAKLREGPTGEGLLGAQQPCLLVAASWQTGELEYHRSKYRQCAPSSVLRRSGPPLIASGMQPSTGAEPQMSAVGMIFAPAAHRVRVTLANGRTKTIRLRSLDPAHAGTLGLGRLRYAAFAIHGTWCAERLVSLGASGRPLWDSGVDEYRCGEDGPPKFAGRPLLSRPAPLSVWRQGRNRASD